DDPRRQANGERGAYARCALDRNVTSHRLAEVAGDREAPSPSAPPARRRRGPLGEWDAKPCLLFGVGTDARGPHPPNIPARVPLLPEYLQADRSPLRELAGVGEDIEQALAYLGQVGKHATEAFRTANLQPVRTPPGKRLDRGNHIPDHVRHVEGLEQQIHL